MLGLVCVLISVVCLNVCARVTDIDILNYALSLEHLEYAFYRDGLVSLGSNTSDPLYPRLVEIRDHEKAHVTVLSVTITELGGTPVHECTYDFGYTDSASFLGIARVLESVGVSAYDGAISEVSNKRIATGAATIATIEARHAAWLNAVLGKDPFPQAFDSPLDMQSVLTLASPFITSCNSTKQSSVKPRPALVANPTRVSPGDTVNVTSSALTSSSLFSRTWWCIFYTGSVSLNSTLQHDASSDDSENNNGTSSWFCRVPDNVLAGDNYFFVSKNEAYDLENPLIVAGPTILWVQTSATANSTN